MGGLMKAFKDLKECEKQTTINGLKKSDEVVHNVKDEEESILNLPVLFKPQRYSSSEQS